MKINNVKNQVLKTATPQKTEKEINPLDVKDGVELGKNIDYAGIAGGTIGALAGGAGVGYLGAYAGVGTGLLSNLVFYPASAGEALGRATVGGIIGGVAGLVSGAIVGGYIGKTISDYVTGKNSPDKGVSNSGVAEVQNFVAPEKTETGDEKHKLLLLQIDGLSKPVLEKALKEGIAPNIQKLIDRETHILRSFSCGIATVTVPILSSIFYGKELPANDWYDKKTGEMIDSSVYEEKVQEEVAREGKRGMLSDGVAYSSPFSGGAQETGAVVSTLKKSWEEKGFFKTLGQEIKTEVSLLKRGNYSLTKAGWRVIRDIFKLSAKFIKAGRFKTKTDKLGTILMSLNEHIIPQMATEGIKKAIDEHKPTAYVDYASYDEMAHYFGPESKEAFDALSNIDKLIGQVIDKADASKDNYDLFVFSDHGQTPCNLFTRVYGKKAGDAVKEMAKECNPEGFADGDIAFSDAYSLGDIYFTPDKSFAVDMKDIEKKYPGYTDKLINHPGIGLVVGRDGENYVMKGKTGTLVMDRKGQVLKQEKENPITHFGDEALLRKHINNYMNLEQTGDIVIFGEYDGEKVVDFNKKYSLASLHGGIGGNQTNPFIVTDASLPIADREIVEATDINKIYNEFIQHIDGKQDK